MLLNLIACHEHLMIFQIQKWEKLFCRRFSAMPNVELSSVWYFLFDATSHFLRIIWYQKARIKLNSPLLLKIKEVNGGMEQVIWHLLRFHADELRQMFVPTVVRLREARMWTNVVFFIAMKK